ncbi:hypothetical protein LEAN103870_03960 [Legionella anisa]|uniref:Uncharacterized protein n=1 Tax=Legionella anisa TaxID=28082 RepID=A0AAX0WQ69_9GAMM|nr:hypothetical protein [Legionella anisa]AWN72979.1 hypothetical protein DLD14_03500 [Legionella anisa]KTC70562.1 hypothetical protein Lani_2109 [Legionella anisa]MBN5935071.1 hypothetical protein [Legionella anisa]MCW8423796.1 hypothetical protein [Legionella anisa]MCW8447316.1 hypothetical protein [Legionella anisa]
MMKIASLLLGIVLTGYAFADDPKEIAAHKVSLAGLQPGEGRFIRSDVFENNKFQSGSYFCAGADSILYDMQYVFSKSREPFHAEHLIKFSICQDETMAQCQEFATDKYFTFRNLDGYLQNDSTQSTVDVSPLKVVYQSCEPNEDMDELVKKSIHENDRRFSTVG